MTRCPFATWRPITANFTHGGRQSLRGFVPHVQVGTGSLWGFFNTPKPAGEGASADFWCSKAGDLEQYVDLADQAWAQGSHEHNGNPYFVSCEFEGDPSEPMTPQQIANGGQLIAWVRTLDDFPLVVNLDPDASGITPHHVFGGGHTCPGPGPREGQFPDLIAAAQSTTGGLHMDADVATAFKDVRTDVASTKTDVDRVSADVTSLHQKVDKVLAALAAGGGGTAPSHFTGTVELKAAQ